MPQLNISVCSCIARTVLLAFTRKEKCTIQHVYLDAETLLLLHDSIAVLGALLSTESHYVHYQRESFVDWWSGFVRDLVHMEAGRVAMDCREPVCPPDRKQECKSVSLALCGGFFCPANRIF